MSKLTEEQKASIKSSDKTQAHLDKEFGVSVVTISKVKGKGNQHKSGSGLEIQLDGDSLVIKLPKKALTKKLLADLL